VAHRSPRAGHRSRPIRRSLGTHPYRSAPRPDRDMQVVVMPTGDIAGVVHAAAAVVAPSRVVTSEGPDSSLPDQVLDAEDFGVVLHPVRDLPPGFELRRGGALPNSVAAGQIAGPPQRVFGDGAGSRRVADPGGVGERGGGLGVKVQEAGGDPSVAGGVVYEAARVTVDRVGLIAGIPGVGITAARGVGGG